MKHPLRLLALASTLNFTGAGIAQAGAAPFEISMRREGEVAIVELQAVANHVVLSEFQVNRGNCKSKLGGIYPLPLTFKFGEGVKLFAYLCSVKEIALVTDQGVFTYSFGPSTGPVASPPPPAPSKPRGRIGESCYQAKLKDYQKGMGPGAPVSYALMNEWRGECAMPPL